MMTPFDGPNYRCVVLFKNDVKDYFPITERPFVDRDAPKQKSWKEKSALTLGRFLVANDGGRHHDRLIGGLVREIGQMPEALS